MGNQTSNQQNDSTLVLQKLLPSNKHFSNQSIRNLPKQKIHELIKDLNIDTSPLLNNTDPSTQLSINSMVFNDDFFFDKISHRLKWRTASQYPHIFNIKNIIVQQHKNLCSLIRKIYVAQDSYEFTLKDLIQQKTSTKESFPQEEIIIILSKITQAVVWMHDNQFRNIPFDSQSVTFVKDSTVQDTLLPSELKFANYTCKIIDQDLVQTNSYKIFLETLAQTKHQPQNQNKKPTLQIYLSPQLLEQAKSNNFYPTNLGLKSDIFTIGMIIMELCCQEEMYFCYNLDNLTFDYESLIHRIAKISYSNELKLLLAEMLEYDENNRTGFVSLKEKLSKLISKPFQETRKLKRRSSSTMLRELLSCSRASASVQNKEPTQKNGLSRISTLSRSNKKMQENTKIEDTQNRGQSTNQSLRKINSLVNLKCRTSSFLTSKKQTLMRVNSNTKLQTDAKKLNDLSCEVNKVNYKNILKNRMKTESRTMQCPGGEGMNETSSSHIFKFEESDKSMLQTVHQDSQQKVMEMNDSRIGNKSMEIPEKENVNTQNHNHDNHLASQQKRSFEDIQKSSVFNPKYKESSKLSYVQKKVINLDKLNISSHSVSNLKLKESKHLQLHTQAQKYQQSHVNQLKDQHKALNPKILTKQSLSTTKITKKQTNLSVRKTLNLKSTIDDVKSQKTTQSNLKIEESSIGMQNKNWIMGKLKSNKDQPKHIESSISNLMLVKKDKSSNKKKESSLTKHKTVSFINPSTQPFNETVETERIEKKKTDESKQNLIKPSSLNYVKNDFTQTKQLTLMSSNHWNSNDTIIKRLQLTQEKQSLTQRQNDQKSSRMSENIKDQMELINQVLSKCQLSSSRWQEESQKFDFKGYETERNIEFGNFPNQRTLISQNPVQIIQSQMKQQNTVPHPNYGERSESVSQFKKKSKVIDIDLGSFQNQNKTLVKQNNDESRKGKTLLKDQKKPSSKLQKLKQLTIFTEQTPSNEQPNQQKQIYPQAQINCEDKQNSMLNSNLQFSSLLNPTSIKLPNNDNSMDNLKKPSGTQFSYQTHHMLNYNPIPRVQHLNLAYVTPSLITPNNLNDLNRFYGKGITFQSVQQSLGSTLQKKDFSTLSKPFQQIQLNYTDTTPLISSPNLPKDFYQPKEQKGQPQSKSLQNKSINQRSQRSSQHSSIKKDNRLYSINAEELTFRLKPKISDEENDGKNRISEQNKIQKMSFFEKQDGSFVMREQNPIKNIQTSSIIGQDKSKLRQRNTVEQLFKESSKFGNYGQSSYNGLKESFYEQDEDNSQKMNSSCDSINLSQIQCKAQRSTSFIYPEALNSNERQRKFKHISILESENQSFDRPKNLHMNLKNLKQITQRDESRNQQTNRHSEYDTYRRYLSSNKLTSKVELGDNFVYEGQVNEEGEFEGNGMISIKNEYSGENGLIYTGSFVNGVYHGFGTLYEIENAQEKRVRLPSSGKRISFGQQRMQQKSQMRGEKHFSLSEVPIKYEGEFVSGQQNGFGTYTYENGDRFSGCIKEGVIQGYGSYHFSESGESISGIWKNGSYSDC